MTAATAPKPPAATADDALLAKLQRMGIDCWEQVLLCVPRRFLDYSDVSSLRDAMPQGKGNIAGEPRLFSLHCLTPPKYIAEPRKRYQLKATDGAHTVAVTIFMVAGVDFDFWKGLKAGDHFYITASLQNWGGTIQTTNATLIHPDQVGKVLPVYSGKPGVVAAEAVQRAVRNALPSLDAAASYLISQFEGLTEREIIDLGRLAVPGLRTLLRALHEPESMEEGEAAVMQAKRLAAFGVVWAAKRAKQRRTPCEASRIPVTLDHIKALVPQLPWALTGDQKRAIRDICHDLANAHPMRRVLSGDVGSGKTYAYMLPAVAAQRLGALVCVLTPNSLLVDQLAGELARFFPDVPVVRVTGGSSGAIDLSGNPLLIGTTALLDRLRKLGVTPAFTIVDEQHRFSVDQKTQLAAAETNLLEATATPIPRTTALVTHAGMDVSIIRESPVDKTIVSHIVGADDASRVRLRSHTRRVIDAGGQVAVVYPMVDDKEQERKSVIAEYERWAERFPGRVGLLHGRLKDKEKAEVIERLKSGELSICVTTTVIELGLTLPSLKSVVVVHAERYGVSQLHQLRGRVARHGGIGHFFMYLPEPVGDEARARLQLVEALHDGFALAERDAEVRGYGDFSGEHAERQHGASKTLFFGLLLRPDDLQEVALRLTGGD